MSIIVFMISFVLGLALNVLEIGEIPPINFPLVSMMVYYIFVFFEDLIIFSKLPEEEREKHQTRKGLIKAMLSALLCQNYQYFIDPLDILLQLIVVCVYLVVYLSFALAKKRK